MPKIKVQDYLHELIKNLSQTEKRYFKLLAKQQTPGKKNDYIKLFEEIDKQDVFDEEKIKEIFKGTSIEKRYASLKKYLYELVIKSLTFYNSDTLSSIKLRRMLDAAEILYKKGLYHQAHRKLVKAESLALEVGMHFSMHEIRSLKMKCQNHLPENFNKEVVNEFKAEQEKTTNQIQLTNLLFNKNQEVLINTILLNEKASVFSASELISTLGKDFFDLESKIENSYNKYLYLSTAYNYYVGIHDSETAQDYNNKILDLFETEDLNRKHLPSEYVQTLFNCIKSLDIHTEKEEATMLITLCKEFFTDSTISYYNKNNDIARLMTIEQSFALEYGAEDEIEIIGEMVEEFQQNKRNRVNTSTNQLLNYNQAWIKLKNGELKQAMELNNEVLNSKNSLLNTPLYSPTVIQNILIHFELKNFSYLEFAIKSFHKELKKNAQFTEVEEVVFEFFFNNLSEIAGSPINNSKLFTQLYLNFEASIESSQNYYTKVLLNWLTEKAGKPVVKAKL